VTRWASPSSTRSMPRKRTDTLHAGFMARLRDLRVPGPPRSTARRPPRRPQRPPSAAARRAARSPRRTSVGLRRVAGQDVARAAPRQFRDPYWSRLRVEIGSLMVSVILMRRTVRRQIDTRTTKIVQLGQTGAPPNPISLPSGSRRPRMSADGRLATPRRSQRPSTS